MLGAAIAVLAGAPAAGIDPAFGGQTGAPAASGCPGAASPLRRLGLQGTARVSSDGVATVVWSGHVASWDQIPLDVDLTLPAAAPCGLPLLVFGHGWGDSKAAWERSTRATPPTDANASRWNTTWFASLGDASLTFSMRGWHGSCGPDASSDLLGSPAGLPVACTAGGRQYWVHLDDLRYEIRDAQWLVGRLVDTGVVDPDRVIATGGSYGGGQAELLALANDRVVCGGVGWDAARGPDPCRGVAMGHTVGWRSPAGRRLHIAGAVPEYTWGSLVNALLPNGRASTLGTPDPASLASPVGVPIESYIAALFVGADTPPLVRNGFLQPPTSGDDTADLPLWFATIAASTNTVAARAPLTSSIIGHAISELGDYKSPLTPLLAPDARVPLLQIQGLTDPLFRPVEALMFRNRLLAAMPGYPITTELGDVGHPYAANPADVWARFNRDANAFVDHLVHGTGPATAPDVVVAVTRCGAGRRGSLVTVEAPSWPALSPVSLDLRATTGGATTNLAVGVVGLRTDPVLGAGVLVPALALDPPGCPVLAAEVADPGTVAWRWPITRPTTLVGAPVVRVVVRRSGSDAELDARLWDVGPDGSEALVSRGTCRLAGVPSSGPVAFELSANAWRLGPGHVVKLELTGADAPYLQPDLVPSTVTITSVDLHLPLAAVSGTTTRS